MKRYIFLILLLCAAAAHAQSYDSLKRAIDEVRIEQSHIQLNLERSHDQFRNGVMYSVIGLVTTAIGTVIHLNHLNTASAEGVTNQDPPYILMIGAGVTTAGVVITIDSHKWIGRASRRRR